MPKQLQSKTERAIQNSLKTIEVFDLPMHPDATTEPETRSEWFAEMNQEYANMTEEQKIAEQKQGSAQLARMRKLQPTKFKERGL